MRPPWLVQIRRSPGGPAVGAGFLAGAYVLTCAHVVQERPGVSPPDVPVHLVFEWAGAPHEPIPARVAEGGWLPDLGGPADGHRADIAVLEPAGPLPAGAAPAPLRRLDDRVRGHAVLAYGYPRAHETGAVPARGEVAGWAGAEWLGLESLRAEGHPMGPGFSGGPLWDDEWDAVIGMLVARDKPGSGQRTAYAITVDELARYWPPLAAGIDPLALSPAERDDLVPLLDLPLTPAGTLPTVDTVDREGLGISPAKYSAERNRYVPRPEIDAAVAAALHERRTVLLTGHSKAGKSRTMLEALARVMPDALVIMPKPTLPSLRALTRLRLPLGGRRAVLWLEDLDQYLQSQALDAGILQHFQQHRPEIVIAATMTGAQYHEFITKPDANKATRTVLRKFGTPIEVAVTLSDGERQAAAGIYPEEDFAERGIGEVMVAAPLLDERYAAAPAVSPHGWAVLRAAVDWRRTGIDQPIPEGRLRTLAARYLATDRPDLDDDDAGFAHAVAWLRDPVAGTSALLSRSADGGGYLPFDYILAVADGQNGTPTKIPGFTWSYVVDTAPADKLLGVAIAAVMRDEPEVAGRAAGRAQREATDPEAAAFAGTLTGELAMAGGDTEAAIEIFGRLVDSPVEDAAELARLSLSVLLIQRGDLDRAGELLEGLTEGSSQVADEARVRLAGLAVNRDSQRQAVDRLSSVAAAVRAAGGHADPSTVPWFGGRGLIRPMAQVTLAGLLMSRGETGRSRDLLTDSLGSDVPEIVALAQVNLGSLLAQEGETEEAHRLLEAASGSPDPMIAGQARVALGWLLTRDDATAEAGLRMLAEVAADGPIEHAAHAADLIGDVRAAADDVAGAREAYQRAIDLGHPDWSPIAMVDLALLLSRTGDRDVARELLVRAGEAENLELALRATDLLGDLLAEAGDRAAARVAYERVIASDRPHWADLARIDLAAMLADEDLDAAMAILREAAGGTDQLLAAQAELMLGSGHEQRGEPEQAIPHLERAVALGEPPIVLAARVQLGRLVAEAGDLEAGRELLELALADDAPDALGVRPAARAFLGVIYLRLGRAAEAGPLLDEAIGADQADVRAIGLLGHGRFLLDNGDMEGAAALLVQAVDAADNPQLEISARVHLGVALLALGDAATARDLLESGLGADQPAIDSAARRYLGSALIRLGEPGRAREVLLPLTGPGSAAEETDRTEAQLLLARLAREDGRLDEARDRFRAAADAADPDVAASARLGLGELLAERGELAAATPALALAAAGPGDAGVRARELLDTLTGGFRPLPPTLLVLLGEVAAAEGAEDEARYWFDAAAAGADAAARARAEARLAALPG